ncbi:unnamed protein product [Amoebophrya sp. A120]|nr:unnamed protein product [Amoebophrya sp. A120]|eukprot:GSA120T00021497001.1
MTIPQGTTEAQLISSLGPALQTGLADFLGVVPALIEIIAMRFITERRRSLIGRGGVEEANSAVQLAGADGGRGQKKQQGAAEVENEKATRSNHLRSSASSAAVDIETIERWDPRDVRTSSTSPGGHAVPQVELVHQKLHDHANGRNQQVLQRKLSTAQGVEETEEKERLLVLSSSTPAPVAYTSSGALEPRHLQLAGNKKVSQEDAETTRSRLLSHNVPKPVEFDYRLKGFATPEAASAKAQTMTLETDAELSALLTSVQTAVANDPTITGFTISEARASATNTAPSVGVILLPTTTTTSTKAPVPEPEWEFLGLPWWGVVLVGSGAALILGVTIWATVVLVQDAKEKNKIASELDPSSSEPSSPREGQKKKRGLLGGFDVFNLFSSGSEEEKVVEQEIVEIVSERSSPVPSTDIEWDSPKARDNLEKLRASSPHHRTKPGHPLHHHWNRIAPVPVAEEDIGPFPQQPPAQGVPLHPNPREMKLLKQSNRPGQGKFRI